MLRIFLRLKSAHLYILYIYSSRIVYGGLTMTSESKTAYMTLETHDDCSKILSHTAMSMKMYANSCYKATEFLEISEIDRIKSSLTYYLDSDSKLENFKKELIEDLSYFQKQIRTNHVQKIVDITKQKQQYEKERTDLNTGYKPAKTNFWSANPQKQEHAIRVATIQAKIEQLSQKLAELQQTRPLANAKDILLYRMYMKEKYSK